MNRCHTLRALPALALFLLVLASTRGAVAQPTPYQMSVAVSATIHETPPSITLNWLKDDSAQSYTVSKWNPTTGAWVTLKTGLKTLTYTDSPVVVGKSYEYRVTKSERLGTSTSVGYGYLYTGIDLPAREFSGSCILIVDDTFATDLAMELTRWQTDIIGDGWKVIRHDVKRSDSVQRVKQLILNDLRADTTIRSLFLFGHVPVPYSGFLNPDGHPNHYGAWPADMYYGDTNTLYTDEMVDSVSMQSRQPNANFPGDGKFDITVPDAGIALEIGRVDLSHMPSFTISEKELLRNYLNKDHAFRIGTLAPQRRAFVSDNFGNYGGGFAATAWRNFPNFVGENNIQTTGSWFSLLDTASFLWAYGCGGGSDNSAGGIGTTSDFAKTDTKAVFTILFGSYFGDWNMPDNFLRAPLTSSSALTCCWSGRPFWYFHHMSMGETIGNAAKITMNNYGSPYDPGYGAGMVHIALMGDPTLRMAYPTAPGNYHGLAAILVDGGAHVEVGWNLTGSADGFYVYRAHHYNSPFVRITSMPVTGSSFVDTTAFKDSDYYMVRAVTRAGGSHGTYYVVGQASSVVSAGGLAEVAEAIPVAAASSIGVAVDGPIVNISVQYASSQGGSVAIYDVMGRQVLEVDPSLRGEGGHRYAVDTRTIPGGALPAGVYFVRLTSPETQRTTKFVIER